MIHSINANGAHLTECNKMTSEVDAGERCYLTNSFIGLIVHQQDHCRDCAVSLLAKLASLLGTLSPTERGFIFEHYGQHVMLRQNK